jgi:4-carboxymuconolactone decarboxylase
MRVRGHVRGPFAVWINAPEVAEKAVAMQDMFGTRGTLNKRLFELMVLIMARRSSAQFAWFAHVDRATRLGLASHVIETLRTGGVPQFDKLDEQITYEITVELDSTRTLSPSSYEKAVATFGVETLVELVSAIGFYSMVAMTLNAFDAPVPGGRRPLPEMPQSKSND